MIQLWFRFSLEFCQGFNFFQRNIRDRIITAESDAAHSNNVKPFPCLFIFHLYQHQKAQIRCQGLQPWKTWKNCVHRKSLFFLSFFLQCDTTGRCTALFVFFIFTCFWISIRKHHRGNLNYSNLHRCLFTAYIIWYLNIKLAQQKTLN